MAYTKEPRGAEDADSAVAVVRKSSRFRPLLVSCRWNFVCGAFGRGNETCIGACDALPSVKVAAIAGWRVRVKSEVGLMMARGRWGNIANLTRETPTTNMSC
jgi:hypothetical protein